MIPQPGVDAQLARHLHVVLHEKLVVGVSHARPRLTQRADGKRAVAREVVQRLVGHGSLKIERLVILIAHDLCAELDLVAALHPRKRVQPGEGIVRHLQIERRRTHARRSASQRSDREGQNFLLTGRAWVDVGPVEGESRLVQETGGDRARIGQLG